MAKWRVMKATLTIAIRLIALTALYFISFAAVSAALLSAPSEPAPAEAGVALAALLVLSFLNAVVSAYVVLRSRWAGWKLIVTFFFVFYGVTTVMPQIETAFFVTRLPAGMLPRLFLSGAVIAALFSPLAVLILGKRRPDPAEDESHPRLNMPAGEWVAKLALIVIAYVVIYFTFGYFIAWKSAAVRAYYGGSDPGSFAAQMSAAVRDRPLLLPLQMLRALLWAAIAVPVIRMMKGQWWEAGLAVGLLFAVPSAQLLLPNPFMPREVRMAHLLETASSNFLFGWLIVLVLRRRLRFGSLVIDSDDRAGATSGRSQA
jgi:hypothetical protein